MQEFIYHWLWGIIGAMIVNALAMELLPGKGYAPYVRLFTGLLIVLAAARPLLSVSGVGGRLADFEEEWLAAFSAEGTLSETDFEGIFSGALEQTLTSEAKERIRELAEENGFSAAECEIVWEDAAGGEAERVSAAVEGDGDEEAFLRALSEAFPNAEIDLESEEEGNESTDP